MNDVGSFFQQGSSHAWLFIPSAILIGALHGLEPGHSKTMMAAFIIAIRGTIGQAVLLGVCAAFSHSLVIWGLAATGLAYGQQLNAESVEPYFQIVSGTIIILTAAWMAWRTYRDLRAEAAHLGGHGHAHHHGHTHEHSHDHHHDHDHGHHQGADTRRRGTHGGFLVATGHGNLELSVFETDVPPRFEIRFLNAHTVVAPWKNTVVGVETLRQDGAKQKFEFVEKDDVLFSTTDIPEPHEFLATLSLDHGGHAHTYEVPFTEDDHVHAELTGLSGTEYQDAHERQHAMEIEKRFTSGTATNGQIALFGLTGGLLPCPAALTVLLLCLQLKKFVLGFTLVLCFSIGLAMTLVATGAITAWSVRHATARFEGFSRIARRVPYFSSALITVLGVYMIYSGFHHLG